jgi:hypothetical protein
MADVGSGEAYQKDRLETGKAARSSTSAKPRAKANAATSSASLPTSATVLTEKGVNTSFEKGTLFVVKTGRFSSPKKPKMK